MPSFKQVLEDLKENPELFKKDEFCLHFKPQRQSNINGMYHDSDYEIWIANGFWWYGFWRVKTCRYRFEFNLIQKIKFHFAYKKWLKCPYKKRKIKINDLLED